MAPTDHHKTRTQATSLEPCYISDLPTSISQVEEETFTEAGTDWISELPRNLTFLEYKDSDTSLSSLNLLNLSNTLTYIHLCTL